MPLEAHWACFFDLAGWQWEYEPIDLEGWTPTFRVEFPCGHSECPPSHVLLVEVQPYDSISAFEGHRCMDFQFGACTDANGSTVVLPADASAAFGTNPEVTQWVMGHGAGGGEDTLRDWVTGNANAMWKEAGNILRRCR